jgi:hypothetical protein
MTNNDNLKNKGTCPYCGALIKFTKLQRHIFATCPNSRINQIVERAHRASRTQVDITCQRCRSRNAMWRYLFDNEDLYLCQLCKDQVLSQVKKKVDALDVAIRAGSFETNRRKH